MNKRCVIEGCWTAIITPFLDDGSLDIAGLKENLVYQVEAGIDGIVALGTTGESPTLTQEEQETVIRTCRQKLSIPLMVGTGTNCTATTIEKTKKAKAMGADAALIVSPYYNRPTQEGILQHYLAVAEAVDIPIVVYNIQGRTGQNIATSTLRKMAEHPNISVVKEASGSISQISDVLHDVPEMTVMSGDDALTLPVRALGGKGVISVVSNLIPRQMVELCKSDLETAKKLHFELHTLFRVAFLETNPIPIKALMELMGMKAGKTRLPLLGPQPETIKHLQALTPWLNEILTLQV